MKELQQSLQRKDKIISDLQQTISHHEREREIQQLKQQDIASSIQQKQLPVTAEKKTQTATAVSVAHKDISNMTWREGKKTPEGMRREVAAVHGNMAYFTKYGSVRVYSYKNILYREETVV